MGFVLLRGIEAFNISSISRASTRISRLNRIRLLQTINARYIGDGGASMPCTCARGLAGAGLKFRTLLSRDECFPHGRLTIGGWRLPLLFSYGFKSSFLLCFRVYARSSGARHIGMSCNFNNFLDITLSTTARNITELDDLA